jgi:hypothetical protein
MNGLFTYKVSGISNTEFRSVVDWPTAFHIAEIFRTTKVPGKYFSVISYMEHGDLLPEPQHSEVTSLVEGLNGRWKSDVYHICNELAAEERNVKRRQSYEAVQHAGIREYLLQNFNARGMKNAEAHDLSNLAAQAAVKTSTSPAYKPVGDSKARLILKDAICFGYSQESYADHSYFAVSVRAEDEYDMTVMRQNLAHFCAALRTHNGLAGSGCTWSASLYEGEHPFVVFNCRVSISD